MTAWLVKITPMDGPAHWPSFWSKDLISDNPLLLCPLFTTLLDAQKYCLTYTSAHPVPITLP